MPSSGISGWRLGSVATASRACWASVIHPSVIEARDFWENVMHAAQIVLMTACGFIGAVLFALAMWLRLLCRRELSKNG